MVTRFLSKLLYMFAIFFTMTHHANAKSNINTSIEQIEKSTEGRIGVYAINTQNKDVIAYRETELFPTQSTYKVLGAAAILSKIESSPNQLKQKIYFTEDELGTLDFISGSKLQDGMTINELCHAAMTISDTGAMNIIIKELGGKEKLNDFTKSLGNNILSSENGWLNKTYSKGQNIIFTSTPQQMVISFKKIVLENVLHRPFRDLITSHFIDCKTGENRIKSVIPSNWLVGNKTGSGPHGTTNDIAIIWPPKHKPILIGVFYNSTNKDETQREDILAATTTIIINEFIKKDSKLFT